MEPLLIIKQCRPPVNAVGLKNPIARKTMIIFAEDAIYFVGLGRDYSGALLDVFGAMLPDGVSEVSDFVGGKLNDWRSARAQNANYIQFAANVEKYVAAHQDTIRYEYPDLEAFIYRKKIRGMVASYVGFEFKRKKLYFEVKDKNVLGPAVALITELAPQAKIKKKRGPMLKKG